MAKTRGQKETIVAKAQKALSQSDVLLFADFKGVSSPDLTAFRAFLRDQGASFQVVKKRLLKVIFQSKGVAFDPNKLLDGQIGTIFAKGDIAEVAQPIWKFAEGYEQLRIMSGFDIAHGVAISNETVETIGKLPSREVLLAQVLGTMVAPLRAFMYLLQERSKTMEGK